MSCLLYPLEYDIIEIGTNLHHKLMCDECNRNANILINNEDLCYYCFIKKYYLCSKHGYICAHKIDDYTKIFSIPKCE